MSTRANISLQFYTDGEAFRPPSIEVMLYRHYDGYPDELGADIAEKILAQLKAHRKHMEGKAKGYWGGLTIDFTTLVRDFLNDSAPGHDRERSTYEITTGVHGDIEHHYQVITGPQLAGEQRLEITHAARVSYEHGEWIEKRKKTYTLNGFIDMVNRERKATNMRIRTLKATGEKVYQDCELYEIIANWTEADDEAVLTVTKPALTAEGGS